MTNGRKRFELLLSALLLAACGSGSDRATPPPDFSRAITTERLANAASEPHNWLTHGGTYLEQRHSPLTEINKDTLGRLAPAWVHEFDTYRGQEATPLVADGVLYTTSAWSKAYALNAATGELIWSYDPKVPGAAGAKACCDVNSRGPALYMDKLIIATLDGRLIALDRATGAPVWSTVTVDQTKMYTITGAPRVVKDKVVIGNAGAEFGVRGYVSAYDADTGELAWRFYVVPGDPAAGPDGAASDKALAEIAAPTWFGRWYEMGGGGTPWDAIVYDTELDQLYVGTGNGSPWNRLIRSDGQGDNLFLASVLALDPDTGEYIWHYQEAPGESWDFTSTQPMILADLARRRRRAQGHHARAEERLLLRARSANGPGPFGEQLRADLLGDARGSRNRPPCDRAECVLRRRPVRRLADGLGRAQLVADVVQPAHGTRVLSRVARLDDLSHGSRLRVSRRLEQHGHLPRPADGRRPRAERREPAAHGLVADRVGPRRRRPAFEIDGFGGGVLTTAANLLFQGRGTITGELIAFDATTGERLWSHETPNSMAPGPISYAVDGEQYIAVMAGRGFSGGNDADARARNPGRIFAFKLDGKATLPPGPGPAPPANPPAEFFSAIMVAAGAEPYRVYCSRCHGGETHSLNIIPDLRRSAALSSAALWKSIVIDGALEPNGMIGWSQFLSPEEAETIRAYVATQARALQQAEARDDAPAVSPPGIEPPVIEPLTIDPPALDPTAL